MLGLEKKNCLSGFDLENRYKCKIWHSQLTLIKKLVEMRWFAEFLKEYNKKLQTERLNGRVLSMELHMDWYDGFRG